jgi:hypothetical protein
MAAGTRKGDTCVFPRLSRLKQRFFFFFFFFEYRQTFRVGETSITDDGKCAVMEIAFDAIIPLGTVVSDATFDASSMSLTFPDSLSETSEQKSKATSAKFMSRRMEARRRTRARRYGRFMTDTAAATTVYYRTRINPYY